MKVLIATLTAELARYNEYHDSMTNLVTPPGSAKLSLHSSSPARNRNIAIKRAIDDGFTHVFFTDDDQVLLPDTLVKLLAHNKDIVSGLYYTKSSPFQAVAFDLTESNGTGRWLDLRRHKPELIEVQGAGAGCLLIKTEVFKHMTPPWFTLGQIEKDLWGDDMDFFRKVRVETDYKIYLDLGIPVGHCTPAVLWPNYDKGWQIAVSIDGKRVI